MAITRLCLFLFGSALLFGQVVPNLYIVELTEEGRSTRTVRRAAQDRLERRMGTRHRVRGRVETVGNAMVVESTDRAALETTAGVRRVTPVVRAHTNLDRALKSHGITQTWERLADPSRAGAGIKIGIIDTGVDANHPGFQAEDLNAPEGFPKASSDSFLKATNGKVIVQRSYDGLNGTPESIVDGAGHGTAVAMVAAGGRVKSPFGELVGAAPGAWIGAYRVFGGVTGEEANSASFLRALDDAVADGMDVVNISLGFSPPYREDVDPISDAVKRAVAMGVMVVKAAGNEGPDVASVDSPAVAGFGISVGSILNERTLGQGVRLEGMGDVFAVASTGPRPAAPIRGKLVDVSGVDPSGLACNALAGESLRGAVALILRGTCTFNVKLKNAEAAGAIGAVVYTHALDPNPFTMALDDALLPALMVSFESGKVLKQAVAEMPESMVTMTFSNTVAFELSSQPLSSFSSRGPTLEGRISPDLVAVGQYIVTAAGTTEPRGAVFNASGYTVTQGTSFSAPLVAGAYAVLKHARPGLTAGQYRSLLINGSSAFLAGRSPQVIGAGKLDLLHSATAPLTFQPAVLNLGAGGSPGPGSRTVTVAHLGGEAGRYTVTVEVGKGVKPTVEPAEFDLAPGRTTTIQLNWAGEFVAGENFGQLLVGGTEGQRALRIPYWFGVPGTQAANITFLPYPPLEAEVGSTVELWLFTTDNVGLAATAQEVLVTVEQGGGSVVNVRRREELAPGLVKVVVKIGLRSGTDNVFLVRCGDAQARAYIFSQ